MNNFIEIDTLTSASHFLKREGSVDYGWEGTEGTKQVVYDVKNFKNIEIAEKMKTPYPTQKVKYVFDFNTTGNGEPCKITYTNIDKFSILHFGAEVSLGEVFDVSLPIDTLPKETLKLIKAGSTVYVKME